jgi:uncharacterized protein DUF4402
MGYAMKIVFGGAAVALLLATPAFATTTGASTTGNGTITVLQPISISETNNGLDFGTVVQGASTGSVTVANDSTWSSTGGVYKTGSSATPAAAAFQVTGEGGRAISITIGTLSLNGHSVSLTNDIPASPALSGSPGAQGSLTFHVGGTVAVNNGDPTGTFSSTFSVSTDYQ